MKRKLKFSLQIPAILTFVILIGSCKKNSTENSPGIPAIIKVDTSIGTFGDKVTITGSNFSSNPGDNIVTFNNVQAKVAEASPGKLVVTVPNQVLSGDIMLKVGNGPSVKGVFFNIVQPGTPVISSVNPASGSSTGNKILITGVGFDPDYNKNAVTFNDAPGNILNATPTTLLVALPGKVSSSGSVKVTTHGLISPVYNYNFAVANPLLDGRFYFLSTYYLQDIYTNRGVISKGNDKNIIPGSFPIYFEQGINDLHNYNYGEGFIAGINGLQMDIDEDQNQIFYVVGKKDTFDIVRINTKGDLNRKVIYHDYFIHGYTILSATFPILAVDSRTKSIYVASIKRTRLPSPPKRPKYSDERWVFKGSTDGSIPLTPVFRLDDYTPVGYMYISKNLLYCGNALSGYISSFNLIDGTSQTGHSVPQTINFETYVAVNKDSDKLYYLDSDLYTIKTFDPVTKIETKLYDVNNINLTANTGGHIHDLVVVKNHLYWLCTTNGVNFTNTTKLFRADIDGSTKFPVEIYTRTEPGLENYGYFIYGRGLLLDTND